MKNKKILLLTLPLIFNSLFLVSCQQTNVNTGKVSSNSQKDADDVYVTSIEVTTPPIKTNYVPLEEAFDSKGMVVKATWSDGYIEENVQSNKYYVEPSGLLPIGTDHVTIHYGDASTIVNITTTGEKTLFIKQIPVKTDYIVGDIFDPTGLILGYQVGEDKKDIDNFDVAKVTFEKKALKKTDKFVTITYEKLSINIPINVHNQSLKIELEDNLLVDYSSGKSPKGGDVKPISKLNILRNEDGTFNYKDKTFPTYKEVYDEAYSKASPASKIMVKQASEGDFLASIDGVGCSFTVNLKNVQLQKSELYIRGASNWATTLINWMPYQISDIQLSKFMTVEINGVEHVLDDKLILPGCGDGKKGDHSYWTNWHTLDLGTINLDPKLEINTIKFTVSKDKALDENGQCQYIYSNGANYAFGQYDYIMLEDVGE